MKKPVHDESEEEEEEEEAEEEDEDNENDNKNNKTRDKEEEEDQDSLKSRERYRKPGKFNNDNMKKNVRGKVEISRYAYDPEAKVTSANVVQILGSQAVRMSDQEKRKAVKWFRNLKMMVGIFCRDRIIEETVTNCRKKKLAFKSLEDLQNLWLNADSDKKRQEAAEVINDAMDEGYFKTSSKSKTAWKFDLEKEVFEKFDLEYLPIDGQLLGCLAKHASRSKNDVRKRIQEPGKKKHGYIITKKAAKGVRVRRGHGKVVVRRSEKRTTTNSDLASSNLPSRVPAAQPAPGSLVDPNDVSSWMKVVYCVSMTIVTD